MLWAHASNTSRLEQSFREIAEIMKVRGRYEPHADIFKLVHDWLRDERKGHWLLVVDNADDAGVLSARANNSQDSQTSSVANTDNSGSILHHHLSTYLPQSRHGSVLVTSRTRQAAIQVVEDSDIIPIEPMDAAAAHTLLRKKLGDETSDEDIADSIDELAAALDYMPLALAQAAAYIRRRAPRCSVQQYLKEYKQSDHRATSLLNHVAGDLRRDTSASNAILITWQISFDHVRSIRQSAADLLSLMSFFDRQGIPEDLLYGYHGPAKDDDTKDIDTEDENTKDDATENNDSFEDDLKTLRDYSFVTATQSVNIFEMHSLVQLATRKWLESQDQLMKWREQFISNLCAEFPGRDHENLERCQALFLHTKAAMTQRPQSKKSLEEWASLLFKVGRYAYLQGRVEEVEAMALLSKDVRSNMLGHESVETLDSMELIGQAMQINHRYKDAETVHRQTLKIREKVLGRDHVDTLDSMMNLAFVLDLQGRNLEAEATNRQALAMQERVLGHEHPHTLITIQDLGWVLLNQGKYQEGEAMLRQALVLRQKVHGLEHPRTLGCAGDLASALERQGRRKEAEVMSRDVLAISEKVLGREHCSTLMSAHNLAYILSRQDMIKEAEVIYRQTLATREEVLGPNHPDTLHTVNTLASLLAKRGCYGESLALYDRACAGRANVLGEDHPDTHSSYKSRSVVASWERAGSTAIRERDLSYMRVLADWHATRRSYGAATALYDKACAEFQKVLGEYHPTTRECYEDRSRLAAWLQARTSAEAETTSTPFDEDSDTSSDTSSETSSGASSPTEEHNGWREFPIEEATTHQKQTATDRSSIKLFHQESAHNGTISKIPRWLGKPGIQSPRRRIKLQSSVTSLQRRIISFRDTSACSNVERNEGANSGASEPLTRKT